MRPQTWPEWLAHVWAKSPQKGAGGRAESLAQHTWEVLSRLRELISLRPDLPQQVGAPFLWRALFWAAWIHDWGKADAGFQAQLRGQGRWPYRHEVLSLAFVDWIASGLGNEEGRWIAAAVLSHHKDAEELQLLYPRPRPRPRPRDPVDEENEDPVLTQVRGLDAETVRGLWRWLDECAGEWIKALQLEEQGLELPLLPDQARALAMVQYEGGLRVRRWLRNYRHFVRELGQSDAQALVTGTLALRGHLVRADHSASAHVGGLPRAKFEAAHILSSRGLERGQLFQHQTKAAATCGSALLTAPTGSGKTEAALLWAARQAAARGGLPRLFYTLPYQASMNAMQLRLQESFGQDKVGLQHGRSLLALYRALLEREYTPEEATRQARHMQNLVRLNYPPVRVFSPYQMLKAMYRLKGYEALLTDYHGAAFIFDEIHAYEVRRLALILKSMAYLAQHYKARFLVMSATFPTLIKKWIQEALGAPREIVATRALFDRFQRHRLQLLDGELLSETGLERAATDARAGKSVLVVCNLVERAQTVYEELQARLQGTGTPVILLHGRFNQRDRLRKEQLIREATGATSRQRRPVALVATQAVEVSLDIDLDTLYSDPAPLEALVQRFGRVNRRGAQGLAPVHVYRQPDDGQHIYDETLVKRTLEILEGAHGAPLDEKALGDWLDHIYAGEVARDWQTAYEQAASEFDAVCLQTLRAFQADEGLEEMFYCAFDGLEVLPASDYEAYQRLREEEPLRAKELLVPISWGRYQALRGEARVLPQERGMPRVVQAPYDPQIGLTFDQAPDDELDDDDLWD